jgi:hypothetical protein
MEVRMRVGLILMMLSVAAVPAAAQNLVQPPVSPRVVELSGPRFGVTSLSAGVVEELRQRRDRDVPSMISQFGWQFEKAFYTAGSGVALVSEWVGLVGGLEKNLAVPSLSWLVGMRTTSGAEFGIGPNISAAGTGLALAAGITIRNDFVNVPLNVAVVPSKHGFRLSVLSGFSIRRR